MRICTHSIHNWRQHNSNICSCTTSLTNTGSLFPFQSSYVTSHPTPPHSTITPPHPHNLTSPSPPHPLQSKSTSVQFLLQKPPTLRATDNRIPGTFDVIRFDAIYLHPVNKQTNISQDLGITQESLNSRPIFTVVPAQKHRTVKQHKEKC